MMMVNLNSCLVWREGFSYQVDGIYMKIYMRFATNKDVKEQSTLGKNSNYYKYQFIKNKHHKNIFEMVTYLITIRKIIKKKI
jgi:hypothetical protein